MTVPMPFYQDTGHEGADCASQHRNIANIDFLCVPASPWLLSGGKTSTGPRPGSCLRYRQQQRNDNPALGYRPSRRRTSSSRDTHDGGSASAAMPVRRVVVPPFQPNP